MFRPTIAAVIG